ncbi:MAG TPA: 16S rRNA (guanine(966)-N(2))-methyltransferase RsmD [Anaerolineaceae bacterium]|nr:16S rRNA (guanine(966)-N(2))-methyltransferase RsmD [Anaerolineaceae bacterium]
MSVPRIIAGTARGIRLKPVPGDSTRPITDRVKEALFNILAEDILDATMLDLFGGTGSVGIEALSRGARFVRFIDINRQAFDTLRFNLEHTRLSDKAEVVRADAFSVLRRTPDRRFDYIYVAPPQYKGLWVQSLKEIDANPGWLSDESWVIVQIDPVEYEANVSTSLREIEQRKYGSTLLVFYEPIRNAEG